MYNKYNVLLSLAFGLSCVNRSLLRPELLVSLINSEFCEMEAAFQKQCPDSQATKRHFDAHTLSSSKLTSTLLGVKPLKLDTSRKPGLRPEHDGEVPSRIWPQDSRLLNKLSET